MKKEEVIQILAKVDQRLENIEDYLKKINGKILDHENRLRDLEKMKWQVMGIVSLVPIILVVLKLIRLI